MIFPTGAGRRANALGLAVRRRVTAVADAGPAALTALLLLGLLDESRALSPGPRPAAELIALGQGAALYWRRSHPRLVLAVALAGGLVFQLVAPEGLLPYAGLVALWSLASAGPLRASVSGLLALLGVTALSVRTASVGDTQFALIVVVAVWATGEATRARSLAEQEAARRAFAQEQARLARDLHDVIAHSVSVMVLQAAAADDVFERSPDAARPVLRAIEATGREALGELRRILPALGGPPEAAQLRPAPGLDDLESLVEPVRALGLSVDLHRDVADGVTITSGVAVSAYRIVQEALTNTVRHAGAKHVAVSVRADPSLVEVMVLDDGCGVAGGPTRGGGRGIAGMRERVAVLGGTVEAAPRSGGGFEVRARIPLEGAR